MSWGLRKRRWKITVRYIAAEVGLRELLEAPTEITGEVANRLNEAAVWFGVDPERALEPKVLPLSTVA